jgi:hypothetical protein
MAGFKKAKREQVWLKILLTGPSGSGKSFSALRLAKGIAAQCGSGIAYIGTEGSRDLDYSNEFDYDLLQIEDPYTPEKYIAAIDEAVGAGYKVLVIDSITHEWLELNKIHDKMPGNSFTNWGKLKPRHEAYTDKILLSPIHIISTARGKDQWILEEQNGKQVPRKIGLGGQTDKDASYNYTVSLVLDQGTHVASSDKDNTHLFDGRYDVLTEKDGEKLYAWANSSDIPATIKEPKKYEEASMDAADALTEIKKEIIAMCKELGGTKNEQLMEVLKSFVSSGNPNAIRSLDKANECLAAVKGVKPIE